ncbi:GH25 family lysozyme, partial [Bifidobacterium scardovii]
MIHNKNKPLPLRLLALVIAFVAAVLIGLMPSSALADSGVDASNWQGCITDTRAGQARRAGASFAFIKATEGAGYTDPQADCSMRGLKTAGVRRGVYHFARPDLGNSPEAEADWFNSQTRGYMHDG